MGAFGILFCNDFKRLFYFFFHTAVCMRPFTMMKNKKIRTRLKLLQNSKRSHKAAYYNKQQFLPGNVLFWSFDIVLRCVVFVGVLPPHLTFTWTGLRVSLPQAAQAQNTDDDYSGLHAG